MQGFIITTSMQCLVALFYFLLLVENTSSSGFSKEGTLPQMILAQAAVERCGEIVYVGKPEFVMKSFLCTYLHSFDLSQE